MALLCTNRFILQRAHRQTLTFLSNPVAKITILLCDDLQKRKKQNAAQKSNYIHCNQTLCATAGSNVQSHTVKIHYLLCACRGVTVNTDLVV